MSLGAFGAVLLAGAAGGVARVWLAWAVARVVARPGAGTSAVNLLGAFLAGLVVGSDPAPEVATVAAVGFLGAFTTFSTWMVALHATWRTGARGPLALEAVATLALGALLAGFGAWLAG